MHGVTHTISQIRERGVPGYEVEVIGTDAGVDRRLSSVAEMDIPFYKGLQIGVPGLPAIVEALSDGRYDLIHLPTPGPAGLAAWLLARVMELPVIGSYHTELSSYAGLRSGSAHLEAFAAAALGGFYGACEMVLSPSPATDRRLAALGIDSTRIGRWDRGVDLDRFGPQLRDESLLGGEINVLYVGRLTKEKGVELLADAFLSARVRDPRLHLVLAGGGAEQEALRDRLGEHASFLGWLDGSELPHAYASADAFMFASQTDTFGQVILEAQASGLPVVAVDEGGPSSLIDNGETGLLTAADPDALARALLSVVQTPLLHQRLRRAALATVRERTWEGSMAQLSQGYSSALERTTRSAWGVAAA
jgi:glycosyltransferase involved in cell wall biosynthesis